MPYCTSDCYTGTRNASQETDGLIFHGKYVVKAVLEDLIQNTWISEAEEVLQRFYKQLSNRTETLCARSS